MCFIHSLNYTKSDTRVRSERCGHPPTNIVGDLCPTGKGSETPSSLVTDEPFCWYPVESPLSSPHPFSLYYAFLTLSKTYSIR